MKSFVFAALLFLMAANVDAQSRYRVGDPESVTESALTAFLNEGLDARAREDAAVYIAERMAFGKEPMPQVLALRAYEAAAAFIEQEAHEFRGLDRWEMRYAAAAIVDRSDSSDARAVAALRRAAEPARESMENVRIRALQSLTRRAHANAEALAGLKDAALKSKEPSADARRWAINGIAQAARENKDLAGDEKTLRLIVSVLENDREAARWAGAALSSFDLAKASKETLALLAGKLDGRPAPLSNDELVQRAILDAALRHPSVDRDFLEAVSRRWTSLWEFH